ncbi:MAG: hypothetical protein HOV79_00500 [Hamadaea sp.]|nr:hypothetical protein [Hamadaea sp.]
MDWAEFVAQHIPTPATVTVEPVTGGGSRGVTYGPPTPVTPCYVEVANRRVKVQTQDAAGQIQVSSTTVWMPPDAVCPVGSYVTVGGRRVRVLSVDRLDAHGHPIPSHLEVHLE